MFFLDNVDPTEVASLLEVLDPSKTAVNVVTNGDDRDAGAVPDRSKVDL